MSAFLATAEEGCLSAAASALGLTQPTLSSQVVALEQELGVVLFERVGRSVTLTPSGLALLDHVRAMGEAAVRLSLTALGQSQSVAGKVSLTASDVFSAHVLPPVLQRLRELAPERERFPILCDRKTRSRFLFCRIFSSIKWDHLIGKSFSD